MALLALPAAGAASIAQAAAPAPAATATDAELREKLDALFSTAYPPDEPGAAVRVQRGDDVLLRKGYGMADLELGVPIAPEHVFRLGSITKQFTAAAVLMLAEEGKIDLQAPLTAYLPDYPGPGGAATIHQLLSHTGGIPSYTSDPTYWDGIRVDRAVDEMIAQWKDKPLDFVPGSGYTYSNSGYFLLGAVIEKVSGKTYPEFVRERIFEPLGMDHSHYGGAAPIIPGRVEGYDGADDGAAQDGREGYQNTAYLSMTQPYSAGSLLSNVDDLVRWGEALLLDDELLDETWRQRLVTPAKLTDGRALGYAYGLAIQEYDGLRVISHGGGINGFVTWIGYVPEEEVTVVVLSNNTALRPGPQALGQQALVLALGRPFDQRPSVELAPEVTAEYEGVYVLQHLPEGEPEQTRIIRVGGDGVTSQRTGGSKLPLTFSAKDHFHFPSSFTHGRFERGPDGRVTSIWVSPQDGAEERWTRTDRPIPTRTAIELQDPSVMDALVGRYELQPGFVLEVRRKGDGLEAQATGQPAFEILPESESRWFLTAVDAVLEFQGYDDGEADSLVLHQGGRDMPAKRLDE